MYSVQDRVFPWRVTRAPLGRHRRNTVIRYMAVVDREIECPRPEEPVNGTRLWLGTQSALHDYPGRSAVMEQPGNLPNSITLSILCSSRRKCLDGPGSGASLMTTPVLARRLTTASGNVTRSVGLWSLIRNKSDLE